MTSSNKKSFLISFAAGLLYAFGFPSFLSDTWLFPLGPLLGIYLLFKQLRFEDFKFAYNFKRVAAFSYGYYFFGYYWIPFTLSEFGQIPTPFNHLLGLIFPLIIVPQFTVFLLLGKLLSTVKIRLRFPPLVLAMVLTLLEMFIPQQFPAHMGHPWMIFGSTLTPAAYLGVYFYSFLGYWLATALVGRCKRNAIAATSIFLSLFLWGIISPLKQVPYDNTQDFNIRIVQGNVGSFMKVQAENGIQAAVREVKSFYVNQSTKQSLRPLGLIIWPETSYPHLLSSKLIKNNIRYTPSEIAKVIRETGSEIVFGGYDHLRNNYQHQSFETETNALFHFGREGEFRRVYHKIKLIPFGETLPVGPLKPLLSQYIKNINFFAKGTEYTHFETDRGFKFIAPICYEILFSVFMQNYFSERDPIHFIVNVTNDSWYGDTAEPWQHKFLGKWRAVEFQIPIIRATNTGITSVIYPDGSESVQIPHDVRDSLDLTLSLPEEPKHTLFASYGYSTMYLIWIVLLILFGASKTLFQEIVDPNKS